MGALQWQNNLKFQHGLLSIVGYCSYGDLPFIALFRHTSPTRLSEYKSEQCVLLFDFAHITRDWFTSFLTHVLVVHVFVMFVSHCSVCLRLQTARQNLTILNVLKYSCHPFCIFHVVSSKCKYVLIGSLCAIMYDTLCAASCM